MTPERPETPNPHVPNENVENIEISEELDSLVGWFEKSRLKKALDGDLKEEEWAGGMIDDELLNERAKEIGSDRNKFVEFILGAKTAVTLDSSREYGETIRQFVKAQIAGESRVIDKKFIPELTELLREGYFDK